MTVSISTNFVLIESTVLSIPLVGTCVQWQKCEGEAEREKAREAERDLWKCGVEKIKKLLSNIKLTKSLTQHLTLCFALWFSALCVDVCECVCSVFMHACVCVHFNRIKSRPCQ